MKSIILSLLLLPIVTSCFALNPSRTYKSTPEKFGMRYQNHKVKTTDGAELNSWYFLAPYKTNKLLLISHNGEGNMGNYLRRVDVFVNAGFDVLIYDYRGYGNSSEFEIDPSMYIYPHFQMDLISMIQFCERTLPGELYLYGWGIGAGLSLGVGFNQLNIIKIIADTPFLSLEDLEPRLAGLEIPLEVPEAGYQKRHQPTLAFERASPGKLKSVYLMIGSHDPLFTVEDMKELAEKQKNLVTSDIYVIENPGVKDNFRVDKSAYTRAVIKFLQEN